MKPLGTQAEEFALELMEMLADVLPNGNLGFNLEGRDNQFLLAAAEPGGIELQVEKRTVMRLEVRFKLSSSSNNGEHLKVMSSEFAVRPDGQGDSVLSIRLSRECK